MNEPQRLKWVQSGTDDTGAFYTVGDRMGPEGGGIVHEIFLDDHGLGPSGRYHMITVRIGPKEGDERKRPVKWRRIEIPAHMATAWETIDG